MIKRSIEVGRSTCLMGFNAGKGYHPTVVFDATTLRAGSGGVNEVQTVTITGTPTGGTFPLTFNGQTTTNIAYNATASVVEDALEALTDIGPGNVKVTGGPGPGTPYSVAFINALGAQDVPLMTTSSASLTGGTTPAVTVTAPTAGSSTGFDPRIRIGSYASPGTIVKKIVNGGVGDDVVQEFDGSGSIYGLIDGEEEFFGVTAECNRSMPVYGLQAGLVVDARKIHNYVTYKSAFDTWAAAHGVTVRYG